MSKAVPSASTAPKSPRIFPPIAPRANDWQKICDFSDELDRRLAANSARLTVGGEPTFVSSRDRQGEEWHTVANGPTKKHHAWRLLHRLAPRWAAGAMFYDGVGALYPGEREPRWALSCFWRRDGKALWRNPALQAAPGRADGPLPDQVESLARAIAAGCGLGRHLLEAREAPAAIGDDPQANPTPAIDPAGTGTVTSDGSAPVSAHGRREQPVAGWVLPLRYGGRRGRGKWKSSQWDFRTDGVPLIPGPWPLGQRLPLLDLPEGDEIVRTALTVETREGHPYVFVPPLEAVAFIKLVAVIEDAASKLACPVLVGGFLPAPGSRLEKFALIPDPGVLEVNIQPADSLAELRARLESLQDEAERCGLVSYGFRPNGRPVGTGGGHHIVFGGRTYADSPFHRRPDVLASVIRYWNNHPSLSYLFSGLFIGPGSQHARLDESWSDLHEAEIALSLLDLGDLSPDQVLNHLLRGSAGNPHRAEICIDKLGAYANGGPGGLVEFRCFESLPELKLSFLSYVLVAAILCRHWERPCREELRRWGAALHDRFMLPHFVWRDFRLVLDDLRECGLDLEPAWFEPHFGFRFPLLGGIERDGLSVEIRQALEPWPQLFDRSPESFASLRVDSSVDRVEVKLSGANANRHALVCNGTPVPVEFEDGDGTGIGIGSVRFRAWAPEDGLHPTIAPHVPLEFELFRASRRRPVARFLVDQYGPEIEWDPIWPRNATEAGERWQRRLVELPDAPGPVSSRPPRVVPDRHLTLDLRCLEAGKRPGQRRRLNSM